MILLVNSTKMLKMKVHYLTVIAQASNAATSESEAKELKPMVSLEHLAKPCFKNGAKRHGILAQCSVCLA